LGEPEDSGGQTDKEKGGSSGGSDGIWNLVEAGPVKYRGLLQIVLIGASNELPWTSFG